MEALERHGAEFLLVAFHGSVNIFFLGGEINYTQRTLKISFWKLHYYTPSENRPSPKRKFNFPTIHFQVRKC